MFALLEVDRTPRRNVRHNHSDADSYDDDEGEKKLDQCRPFLIHPLLTSFSAQNKNRITVVMRATAIRFRSV